MRIKIFKSIISLTLVGFTMTGTAQKFPNADTWEKVKSSKKGTLVCLWNETYGVVYKENDEQLHGVSVDLLNKFKTYVMKNYQAELELVFVEEKSFSNFFQIVSKTPNILGVSSTSIIEERKKYVRFSVPFLRNPNVIATSKNTPRISTLEELGTTYKGFRAKVLEGSNHFIYLEEYKAKYAPSLKIEVTHDYRGLLEEISKTRDMFTILDFVEFVGATRNKIPLVRQPISLNLIDELGLITHKSSDWITIINDFMVNEYLSSVPYKKSISDNFGSAFMSAMISN